MLKNKDCKKSRAIFSTRPYILTLGVMIVMEKKRLDGLYVLITNGSTGNEIAYGEIRNHTGRQILVKNMDDTFLDINDTGTRVNIFLQNDDNGQDIYSGVIENIGENLISIEQVVFVKKIQRRMEFRLQSFFPLEIKFEYGQSQPLNPPIKGIIRDLSVGGMLFNTNIDIDEDFRFNIDLDIQGETLYIPHIKINRKTFNKKTKRFSYGCIFNGLDEEKISKIRKLIFITQVKHRQIQKETE